MAALSQPSHHTPGATTSPRHHRSVAPPVYELPVYAQANRPVTHEMPGSDTEDTSISSSVTNSRWQSPAASLRSIYSNGRVHHVPPVVDLSDTVEPLNPGSFSPVRGAGVRYPSQAHAVFTPILAGTNPMGPLSPLPELAGEPFGSPDPSPGRVMSVQHSMQGYVVSRRPSQDSWGMSTQVDGQTRYGSGLGGGGDV